MVTEFVWSWTRWISSWCCLGGTLLVCSLPACDEQKEGSEPGSTGDLGQCAALSEDDCILSEGCRWVDVYTPELSAGESCDPGTPVPTCLAAMGQGDGCTAPDCPAGGESTDERLVWWRTTNDGKVELAEVSVCGDGYAGWQQCQAGSPAECACFCGQ